MNAILKRILILSLTLVVVFFVFYTAFEKSTISRTEKEIVEVYEVQLESILFSINQFSQDEVDSWVAVLTTFLTSREADTSFLEIFIADHPAVNQLFIADEHLQVTSASVSTNSSISAFEQLLQSDTITVFRLFEYLQADYQKLEPLTDPQGNFYIVFALPGEMRRLIGLQMDPNVFISEVLAPRLQAVAKQDMILSAFSANQTLVYSTDTTRLVLDEVISVPQNSLWLFPAYYLGVSFPGESLQDLIDERARNNLGLVAMLAVVIVIGGFFIVQAINKQMQLSKMKSDFVSNVSHEIRTPLALISMFAETLEMGRVKDEKERDKFYHIINSETRRLTGLVNRILNFSKMEAGKKTYSKTEMDIDAIVADVLLSYDYHLAQKGFTCTFDECGECTITADKEAVYEAVINLLDNAVKYSGDSRNINIKTRKEDQWVVLSVRDYGMGIRARDQKRIYDKFYRAEDPLVHDTKGSGLGLNIVHEIMQAHNGSVRMKSKPGEGSTFELYFPIDEE
jgi:two-component system phosphate regulon sensor histidine kinase PhoR